MSAFVIAIILMSAFMHAGWNLLARYDKGQSVVFMYRMTLVIAVVGLAPAVAAQLALGTIHGGVWLLVIGSGMFGGIYSFCLARGYETADFTVAYPVARALPVLVVGLADAVFQASPSTPGWLGMAMVASGVTFAPLRSFGSFSLRRYINRGSVWMLLAACGTIGYTILDNRGQKIISRESAGPAAAAVYCYFYNLFSFVSLSIIMRRTRRLATAPAPKSWILPAVGGLLCYGGYWLILWVYQMVPQAGYVLAFRQVSVIIAVVVAFAVYKERGRLVRTVATIMICAGLIVIKVWGS